jgi:iron(III) transport system ATP-binding protein
VALARALVIRPRCLLLDEPLSNLDAKLRLEMRGEIRRICKEFGLTAIYVTHDQTEALSVADRMAILDAGRVRQIGFPREVYRKPLSKFVADFMGATNFIEGTIIHLNEREVRVRTPLREFDGTLGGNAWEPKTGDLCTLSIRPESWRLATNADGRNAVSGRIRDRIYLGEMAQYSFETGAQQLKIYELNPRYVDAAGTGRELFASVEPEDVVALPLT